MEAHRNMTRDQLVAALGRSQNENGILKLKNQILQMKIDQLEVDLASLKHQDNVRGQLCIGAFHSSEVQSGTQPWAKMARTILFAVPYASAPGLAVGLTSMESRKNAPIHIRCHASRIQPTSFMINIYTSDSTPLNSAGCGWLEIPADDLDFQSDQWSTTQHHRSDAPQLLTTQRITFTRQFRSPPHVVVWLNSITMVPQETYRIKTYATNINASSFTLHIDSWANSQLAMATATWVAYTAGMSNVFSGRFTTGSKPPQLHNAGFSVFPPGLFVKPPRIFAAISMLEIGCGGAVRFDVATTHVGVEGVAWKIDGEGDTVLYSAAASFIALG